MKALAMLLWLVGVPVIIVGLLVWFAVHPIGGMVVTLAGGGVTGLGTAAWRAGVRAGTRKRLLDLGTGAISILAGGGSMASAVSHISSGGFSESVAREFIARAADHIAEDTGTGTTRRDAAAESVSPQEYLGRTCPFCQNVFKPGDALIRCRFCSTVHHKDCWDTNRGCTMIGCEAAP